MDFPCFQPFAFVDSAATNMKIHVLVLRNCFQSCHLPRSAAAGSCGNSMLSLLRSGQTFSMIVAPLYNPTSNE